MRLKACLFVPMWSMCADLESPLFKEKTYGKDQTKASSRVVKVNGVGYDHKLKCSNVL